MEHYRCELELVFVLSLCQNKTDSPSHLHKIDNMMYLNAIKPYDL